MTDLGEKTDLKFLYISDLRDFTLGFVQSLMSSDIKCRMLFSLRNCLAKSELETEVANLCQSDVATVLKGIALSMQSQPSLAFENNDE